MTRRCCFLSMDDLGRYVSDDDLAIGPLNDLGWNVETLSWRRTDVDWSLFDIVVIRTTWDYHKDPLNFIAALRAIEGSGTRLENPLSIVEWNFDKHYLAELADRGVKTVPSIWDAEYGPDAFASWQRELGSDKLIIKPTISATAQNTHRLNDFDPKLTSVFTDRPFVVQPFVEAIIEEGEYSLFFFNGRYSHTIIKRPETNDFRVQEEHGGIIEATEAAEDLRAAALKVLDAMDADLLYARVDLVRLDDEFALMELELIEPSLYLRTDAQAGARFAAAIDELMR